MEFTDFSKTSFYYPSSQSVWDFGDFAVTEKNSLGFMELLGSAPSPHSFLLETPQPQTQTQTPVKLLSSFVPSTVQAPPSNAAAEKSVASKVESLCSDPQLINLPATPNSSSISSASSEAVNEEKAKREEEEEEEEEEEQKKSVTNKQ